MKANELRYYRSKSKYEVEKVYRSKSKIRYQVEVVEEIAYSL